MRNPFHPFRSLELLIRKISLHMLTCSALLLGALLMLAPAARAQQTPQTTIPQQSGIPGLSPNPHQPDDTMEHMSERMARQRNTNRQKDIVSDTNQLLKLAQQLKVDVSKSDKNTLSLNVVREAGEIEKLAKTIKDKMKEGY